MYAKMIRVPSKGYLPISLLSPSKLQEIPAKVKKAIQITNPDYDIVLKRLDVNFSFCWLNPVVSW